MAWTPCFSSTSSSIHFLHHPSPPAQSSPSFNSSSSISCLTLLPSFFFFLSLLSSFLVLTHHSSLPHPTSNSGVAGLSFLPSFSSPASVPLPPTLNLSFLGQVSEMQALCLVLEVLITSSPALNHPGTHPLTSVLEVLVWGEGAAPAYLSHSLLDVCLSFQNCNKVSSRVGDQVGQRMLGRQMSRRQSRSVTTRASNCLGTQSRVAVRQQAEL